MLYRELQNGAHFLWSETLMSELHNMFTSWVSRYARGEVYEFTSLNHNEKIEISED